MPIWLTHGYYMLKKSDNLLHLIVRGSSIRKRMLRSDITWVSLCEQFLFYSLDTLEQLGCVLDLAVGFKCICEHILGSKTIRVSLCERFLSYSHNILE